jgi:hypothetical protein
MAGAGYAQAPDPNVAKLERASGLHQTTPSDLNPEININKYDFSPEAETGFRSELTDFCSQLKMQSGLSNHLIEHISKIGPAYQKLSREEKLNWEEKEKKTLTTLTAALKPRLVKRKSWPKPHFVGFQVLLRATSLVPLF